MSRFAIKMPRERFVWWLRYKNLSAAAAFAAIMEVMAHYLGAVNDHPERRFLLPLGFLFQGLYTVGIAECAVRGWLGLNEDNVFERAPALIFAYSVGCFVTSLIALAYIQSMNCFWLLVVFGSSMPGFVDFFMLRLKGSFEARTVN